MATNRTDARRTLHVREEGELGSPASEVWALVGDFEGLIRALAETVDAHVEIEGEGVGALRKITLDGHQMVERFDAHDDTARTTGYSMLEPGPMPVSGYRATIEVTPLGLQRARVAWSSAFEAAVDADDDTAVSTVRTIYRDSIAFLQRRFGA